MSNKTHIVIKSNFTNDEFKKNIVRKIRNIVSTFDIAFVEHSNFDKIRLILPDNYQNREIGELFNAGTV